MTEPDIITTSDEILEKAIDDAGFEIDKRHWHNGQEYVCFRPKRVQTGWKCESCAHGACYHLDFGPVDVKDTPTQCPHKFEALVSWQPFYGKKDENGVLR